MSNTAIVTIEKIIPGGNGLARMDDGLVVMIPMVLPGEKVQVRLRQRKKGHTNAELVEVLESSPMRIDPPCVYYGQCGGCDLQHIHYQGQLQIKEQILTEQLTRNLGENTCWEQCLSKIQPAQQPFSYRQRIRLQVDARGRVGFFRPKSQEVVPVSQCLLAAPKINITLSRLLENKAALNLLKNSEALELLYDEGKDKVVAIIHFTRKPRATDIANANNCAAEITEIKSLFLQTQKWGTFGSFTGLQEDVEAQKDAGLLNFSIKLEDGQTVKMLFEAGGFCQVNAKQNEWLIKRFLEWGNISPETSILDLYCGLGNFSIPAALCCKNMVGMDLQRSAIRSALKNSEMNGLKNCIFEQKSSFKAAQELAKTNTCFDLVILDPPRQGCKEIIPFIDKIAISEIIYISCDPATLARDLVLLQGLTYNIVKIQGLDMFPQTHHIETIVHLKKEPA